MPARQNPALASNFGFGVSGACRRPPEVRRRADRRAGLGGPPRGLRRDGLRGGAPGGRGDGGAGRGAEGGAREAAVHRHPHDRAPSLARARAPQERRSGSASGSIPGRGRRDPAVGRDRRGAGAGAAHRGGDGAPRPFRRPGGGRGTPGRGESFADAGIDGLSPEGSVWTGPLDALLDGWTRGPGYAWRYDARGEAIEIVRRQAVVFRINALAGRQSYAASASTQDGRVGRRRGRRRVDQPVDRGGDQLRPLA